MAADVVDLLRGAPDLLAYGRAEEVLARIEAADLALARGARRRALAAGLSSAVVMACLGAAVLGVLILSADAVHRHQLQAVMVAVLPLATIGAFEAVPPVGQAVLRFGEVRAAGERLLELDAVPVPVRDRKGVPASEEAPGSISLEDARLRYAEDLPWALDGVGLRLEPGRRVAVMGRSGAGKTSIVHALLRFWPLSAGRYELGGRRAEEMRQDDVRRAYGLLDQDADLFAGSIADNILLANPRASSQQVRRAVELAQLSDWIDSLPRGLDTEVGEHGAQVSGGQRQRIAMARVLVRDAPVLLLDEPTAGLDLETAAHLLGDVRRAFEDRAVLLVTHRVEDLAGFDEVLTLESGRVVAGGAPPESLASQVAGSRQGTAPSDQDGG